MRNLLRTGTTLLLMMVAGDALAAEGGQWKSSGKMRIRHEGLENATFSANNSDNGSRTMMGFRWDLMFQPDDKTSVFFQPNFAKNFGWGTGTSGSTDDVNMYSIDAVYYSVHQAYFSHKFSDAATFTAGRQELAYGDHLVIGTVGWSMVGRAFDAIKLRYSMDDFWVDLFSSKIKEVDYVTTAGATAYAPSVGNGVDTDFNGLYFNYRGVPMIKNLDVYALFRLDPTPAAGSELTENMSVYGLRIASDMSGIDYRLEYTTETGKKAGFVTADNADGSIKDASQYDLEVGYTFDMDVKARVGAEIFSASKNYDQLYPTAHKWLGFADVLGRRNVSGFVFHASVPWQDFNFKLDYHMFNRVDKDTSAFKLNGSTALGSATGREELPLGSEIDLLISYKWSAAMSWNLGYSTFTAGDYLKNQSSATVDYSKALNLTYLEMTATF